MFLIGCREVSKKTLRLAQRLEKIKSVFQQLEKQLVTQVMFKPMYVGIAAGTGVISTTL